MKLLEESMVVLDALRESVTEVHVVGDVQWGLVNFKNAQPLGMSDYRYRSARLTLAANGFLKTTPKSMTGFIRFAS